MVLEAYISMELVGLSSAECDEIKAVFAAIYPEVVFEEKDIEAILKLLIYDKKNSHGKINFALLQAIGKPQWDIEVPQKIIHQAFAYYAS